MADEWKAFYQQHLNQYGPSAEGVGWKNSEAQRIRFEQLSKLFTRRNFSLNDLGCGVGDFVAYAGERLSGCEYRGYDVMDEMVTVARERYSGRDDVSFRVIGNAGEMERSHYTIASGIFNIRFDKDDSTWLDYILDTLRKIDAQSEAGFAFNILTRYSDPEYMKKELFYADPCFLFDFCKRNFSQNVALLHDYNQYDFTIIVRKHF